MSEQSSISKLLDEARERSGRRSRKDRKTILATDFKVGDACDVAFVERNGRTVYGRATVLDVNTTLPEWRQPARLFVQWADDGTEQAGHVYEMTLDGSGYSWRSTVRWVGR